jgi:SET domain-containing protein
MERDLKQLNAKYSSSNVYINICDLGLGVFASRNIKCGEIILKFTGRHINYYQTKHLPGKDECMAIQIGIDLYIDTDLPGCLINHSCMPNCGIVNDFFLVAMEDILKETELRYDYSTTIGDDYRMTCKCGKSNCRTIIGNFKNLSYSCKEEYYNKNIVMNYLKEKVVL